MKFIIAIMLLTISQLSFSQTQINSLQEILNLADKNSYTSQVSAQQNRLAHLTTQSAYGNALNPRLPVTASMTDNISLPVTFLPGAILNDTTGKVYQFRAGFQYITTLNFSPQFDILNFGNLAKIKSAKANQELVNHNSLVSKKNLFDQVNACYHNILSFQAQIKILQQNKQKADSLFKIVSNKYVEGLVRKQDVNDAEINSISINDKIDQANLSLQQQYLTLKILCDTEDNLVINQQLITLTANEPIQASGNLLEANAQHQLSFAQAEYNAAKWNNMPTLSFITSFNYQNSSDKTFMDSNNPWINSNFWSLRFSWDLPTNVNKLTTLKSNLISLNIAEINAKHAALQTKLQNEQLEKDLEKSSSQYKNNLMIYKLKLDNYQKSNNQFNANILPLDKLLLAHSDLLMSEINLATCLASISYNKSKIEINNQDFSK